MTGTQLIAETLLLIRRIYPGQTPSTDETATAQLALNNLIGEWNAQQLAVYSVTPKTLALVSGTADYLVGPSQAFNIARPVQIAAWNVKTSSGQANGGVPVDAATFAELAVDRSAQGARVKMLNYDAAYPYGTIHLYPKPSGGTLEIWVWDAIAVITDFTLTLDYPPGYLQGLIENLAVILAPKFERPLDPAVKVAADAAKAALVSSNQSQHPRPPQAPPAQAR